MADAAGVVAEVSFATTVAAAIGVTTSAAVRALAVESDPVDAVVTAGVSVAEDDSAAVAVGSGAAVAESELDECLVSVVAAGSVVAVAGVAVGSAVAGVVVAVGSAVAVGAAVAVGSAVGVAVLGALVTDAAVVESVDDVSVESPAVSVFVLDEDDPDVPVVAVFSVPPEVLADVVAPDADFASFAAAVALADDADEDDEDDVCVAVPPADDEVPESDPLDEDAPEDAAPADEPDDELDDEEPASSASATLSSGPASETPNSATPTPAEAAPVCSHRRTPKSPDRRPGRRCRPLPTAMFLLLRQFVGVKVYVCRRPCSELAGAS